MHFVPRSERLLQRVFLFTAALFSFFLISMVMYRSLGRKSVWSLQNGGREPGSVLGLFEQPKAGTSEIHLQDFRRVEVRNGRRIWETKARDAKYYAEKGLTHVNDAEVIIYRGKQSEIVLRSTAARLFLQGDSLQKAELEGDMEIRVDNSLHIQAELATYVAEGAEITAPGAVTVEGEGFHVKGVGLSMDIEKDELTLLSNVESEFEPRSRVPKGLPLH